MGRKKRGDALAISGEHRGRPFTIRVVDPPLHTAMTPDDLANVKFARFPGRTPITARVGAWICPATLVVEGLEHPIEFRIAPIRPDEYGPGIGIESLTVHAAGARISNQSVPLVSHLEYLAVRLLASRVEITPRHGVTGGRLLNVGEPVAVDEVLIASGRYAESNVGQIITRIDKRRQRKADSVVRRRDRGDQPHWDDPQTIAALRKAVAKLPPLSERKGQHAYVWVCEEMVKSGIKLSPYTVKTMMSKHGLTKKRGKK